MDASSLLLLPSFPAEVVEEVIDRLHFNVDALRNFALTCHEFLPRCRVHLFYAVRVITRDSLNALSAFLDHHPALQRRVCAVTFGSDNVFLTNPPLLIGALPLHILSKLPTVREWRCDGDPSNVHRRSENLSIHRTILSALRGRSVVETLDIQSIHFASYSDLIQLVVALPHLRHLKCRGLSFKKDIGSSRNLYRSKLTRLSTLSVDGLDNALFGLLLGSLTRDALEHVAVGLDYTSVSNTNDVDLSILNKLRSLTISLDMSAADTSHVLRLLSSTQPASLKHLSIRLSPKPAFDSEPYLHQDVQDRLLRLNKIVRRKAFKLESCTFGVFQDKKNREAWWRSKLRHTLPTLHSQSTQVTVEFLTPTGQPTAAVGHRTAVQSLAVSPDGAFAASCAKNDCIILWHIQQCRAIHEWSTMGNVSSVAFSPDSRHLASGGPDATVTIWDVDCFDMFATLEGHTRNVRTCAWSLDGTKLASGADDHIIRVWDMATYQQLFFVEQTATKNEALRFSPDGSWLLSPDKWRRYRIWDTSTGIEHPTMTHLFGPRFYSVEGRAGAFDPTSTRVAIVSTDNIHIWDVKSGHQLVALEGDTQDVLNVSFSPDGSQLMSTSTSGCSVKIWRSLTGALVHSLEGHRRAVHAACFSSDGEFIASASGDGMVRVGRAIDGSHIWTFADHATAVAHVAFSSDQEFLMSGANDGSVCIRRLRHFIVGWGR